MNVVLIIFSLISVFLLIPTSAFSQDGGLSKEEIIDAYYSGPVFLDSYWTSGSIDRNGSELDVAPGDGPSTLAVVLINRGPSDISGITGRLMMPDGFKATGKPAGTLAVATFDQIAKVGNTFTLFFDVDVLDSAKVQDYTARLSIDYSKIFETGVPRNVTTDVPFSVAGKAIVAVTSASPADASGGNKIGAGKMEDYVFSVANKGTAPITSVVVTIGSSTESLKILGDSKWTIQRIEKGDKVDLTTTVFAAKSLIGNPALFDVVLNYSSNGLARTEKFAMGTYVAGEISIKAYDIAVEYIGGAPNIVGNLLNEGNTVALFSSIEVASAQNLVSELPPQQYIGDLQENSPLPFSIPVKVDNGATAGTYPVSLKVSYKDDLKENHFLDINTNVQFVPEEPATKSSQNVGIMNLGILPFAVVTVAAAAVGTAVAFRRRKKAALRRSFQRGQDDDIESLLDSPNKKDAK